MKNQAEIWLMKCMLTGRKPPLWKRVFICVVLRRPLSIWYWREI
jgi:hypothetical protein